MSGFCLLDLTAVFDTVDHDLLLQRLDNTFGVRDQAKEWFKSYLTGRSYCVIYGGGTSAILSYSGMLCATGLGFGSAVVHFVHSGIGRPGCRVRRQITRIRGRQPATRALRS